MAKVSRRNPTADKIKVLFVCLGNICRSPTAHGVFRAMVEREGLDDFIEVDSAGTGDWHIGRSPDSRAIAAAKLRGYSLEDLQARQIRDTDLSCFDYVLAMDSENLLNLEALSPAEYSDVLVLFLEFSKETKETEVPDPYYGGGDGFEQVLDLIESASFGLLEHIKNTRL